MEAKTIGRAIGAASLAFGITDILMGKAFGRGIGAGDVEGGTLFRTVGAREVVTGAVGLAFPASSVPVWTRFAADLTDMACSSFLEGSRPMRPTTIKTLGYLVSTVSVALLGIVSWKSASEQPLLCAALIGGTATSILGMGLRWLSYRIEKKTEGKS
jgi:hypothetical protein